MPHNPLANLRKLEPRVGHSSELVSGDCTRSSSSRRCGGGDFGKSAFDSSSPSAHQAPSDEAGPRTESVVVNRRNAENVNGTGIQIADKGAVEEREKEGLDGMEERLL